MNSIKCSLCYCLPCFLFGLFSAILPIWFIPCFSFQLLFGGRVNLIFSWFSLHFTLFFFLCYLSLHACLFDFCDHSFIFTCVFWAFFCLHCLFPPYLIIFFSFFGGCVCLIFAHQLISSYPFIFLLPSPLAPVLFLAYKCHFSAFLPILFTHTSKRDTAWVHQGRTELVPNWQGIACFMCVIENANAQEQWLFSQFFCWRIYEEHQTPLWSFRSRPFSTAITWVDKGIPKANHSPSSLLWIRLFSRRWKFTRNAIYLQAWFQQLHAEGSTLCTEKKIRSWQNMAVWI